MQTWQWKFDSAQNQLHLLMDEGLMHTLHYQKKNLRPDMPAECSFSIEDAQLYIELLDYQASYSTYSATEQLLMALHGVAIQRFSKALMPQSWHFQTAITDTWPETHRFCSLNSGFAKGNFLLVSQDERTALCMLVDPSFEVTSTKTMKRFDVIRVQQDRLLSHEAHPLGNGDEDWQQFA